jgi:hypothetical protein
MYSRIQQTYRSLYQHMGSDFQFNNWRCFIVDLLTQRVNLIGRSWRTWKMNKITRIYLNPEEGLVPILSLAKHRFMFVWCFCGFVFGWLAGTQDKDPRSPILWQSWNLWQRTTRGLQGQGPQALQEGKGKVLHKEIHLSDSILRCR